ncbi:hypothetical protein OPIT5_05920 [Opitutaceae bacterium TAV5]|nr:hypothetical protein OPIT5_05920 [Opitutaceae bacterium TAV5]
MASSANSNRSSRTLVQVGDNEFRINQKKKPSGRNLWISVTEVTLDKGETLSVVISNKEADGHVVVDAVRLLPRSR